MANFYTAIDVEGLQVEDAFGYLADFSSSAEWDPGVVRASRNDEGPIGVGSSFEVAAAFLGRTVDLTYEIVEFRENDTVTLRAENASVVSLDTLTFTPTESGTIVSYDADLVGKGAMRLIGPVLQLLFNRIGRDAEAGLRQHLVALATQQADRSTEHRRAA